MVLLILYYRCIVVWGILEHIHCSWNKFVSKQLECKHICRTQWKHTYSDTKSLQRFWNPSHTVCVSFDRQNLNQFCVQLLNSNQKENQSDSVLRCPRSACFEVPFILKVILIFDNRSIRLCLKLSQAFFLRLLLSSIQNWMNVLNANTYR